MGANPGKPKGALQNQISESGAPEDKDNTQETSDDVGNTSEDWRRKSNPFYEDVLKTPSKSVESTRTPETPQYRRDSTNPFAPRLGVISTGIYGNPLLVEDGVMVSQPLETTSASVSQTTAAADSAMIAAKQALAQSATSGPPVSTPEYTEAPSSSVGATVSTRLKELQSWFEQGLLSADELREAKISLLKQFTQLNSDSKPSDPEPEALTQKEPDVAAAPKVHQLSKAEEDARQKRIDVYSSAIISKLASEAISAAAKATVAVKEEGEVNAMITSNFNDIMASALSEVVGPGPQIEVDDDDVEAEIARAKKEAMNRAVVEKGADAIIQDVINSANRDAAQDAGIAFDVTPPESPMDNLSLDGPNHDFLSDVSGNPSRAVVTTGGSSAQNPSMRVKPMSELEINKMLGVARGKEKWAAPRSPARSPQRSPRLGAASPGHFGEATLSSRMRDVRLDDHDYERIVSDATEKVSSAARGGGDPDDYSKISAYSSVLDREKDVQATKKALQYGDTLEGKSYENVSKVMDIIGKHRTAGLDNTSLKHIDGYSADALARAIREIDATLTGEEPKKKSKEGGDNSKALAIKAPRSPSASKQRALQSHSLGSGKTPSYLQPTQAFLNMSSPKKQPSHEETPPSPFRKESPRRARPTVKLEMEVEVKIRKATISDIEAVTDIYNEIVRNNPHTFDSEEKTVAHWFKLPDHDRYPLIVAVIDGQVVGWACANKYSDRRAYDLTGEVSIFVADGFRGIGLGAKLLVSIIDHARAAGLHSLISRVPILEGYGAIKEVHEHAGFRRVGVIKEAGRRPGSKFWDVSLFQVMLI